MRTSIGRVVTVVALVVTAILAPALASPEAPGGSTAEAADLRYFDPENIISDNLFYVGDAMSAAQVQTFLNAKGASCVAGEMPCLKNYRQDTATQAGDALCKGYRGARDETAAAIIAKVGASCGISQRVLLVLLQKEQSLVSGSEPKSSQYTKATGFACPDTAPCNPAFKGFVSQVYFAARQFQRYRTESWAPYKAFRTYNILYNPDRSCGSAPLYLRNHATAGLYNYTPYQPNAATLKAGAGTAPCGAYGNRNFWLYYTNWFGSTQSPGGNAIVERAGRTGAAAVLGTRTSEVRCGLAGGGCYQTFQKASIYWSPSSGARIILGSIRNRWGTLGWERSRVGYPTSEERCGLVGSGCFQTFQRGSIYWSSATGSREILGSIRAKWAAQGWEEGALGYPTTGESCGLVGSGCLQQFQGGTVYWSTVTGARIVTPSPVRNRWRDQGWETGPLGYPTSDTNCRLRDGGCVQLFQGGSVYSSPLTGTRVVSGAALAKWGTVRWENGPLGYPTGDTTCGLPDEGCSTTFESGDIYSSAGTGAHIVGDGEVRDAWVAQGGHGGPLGYPTADTACGLADGGCRSEFQGGGIAWTPDTGALTMPGSVHGQWLRQGAQAGPLGYPTGSRTCGLPDSGCYQQFQGGRIYSSASTGAQAVRADVVAAWSAHQAQDGPLGYPALGLNCRLDRGGCVQKFQGGLAYATPANGVRLLWGDIRQAYDRARWETGPLRYPTSDARCGLADGGCLQRFEGGTIYWSAATRAHYAIGGIGAAYGRSGAEAGPLRYPTMDEKCGLVRRGCFQHFQGGSVYYSPATGARLVTGAIRDYWASQRWERGPLGYPVAAAVTGATERTQRFEGGTLVENLQTHRVTVRR